MSLSQLQKVDFKVKREELNLQLLIPKTQTQHKLAMKLFVNNMKDIIKKKFQKLRKLMSTYIT
jgi:hypothetical protein